MTNQDVLQDWPKKDPKGKKWVYFLPEVHHPNMSRGQLTLHEVGEVLRRAALTAGLVPDAEVKLKDWKIDWRWCARNEDGSMGRTVAVFEIEGRDVEKTNNSKKKLKGIEKDFKSMAAVDGDCLRVIILYTIGKAGKPKGKERNPTPQERVDGMNQKRKYKDKYTVELCYDADLFARLPDWIQRATALANPNIK